MNMEELMRDFVSEMEERIEDKLIVQSVPSWEELERVVEREKYDQEKKQLNHLRHQHTNYDDLCRESATWVKDFLKCQGCDCKVTLNRLKREVRGRVKVAVNRKIRLLFPRLKRAVSQSNNEIHVEAGDVTMAFGRLAGVPLRKYPASDLVTLLMSRNTPGSVRHAAACFIQELLLGL